MTSCEREVLEGLCRMRDRSLCVVHSAESLSSFDQYSRIIELRKELGRFHGRSSYYWNQQDQKKGRKVWFNSFERPMRSERHVWASLNYIHHNPVHHGYANRWQEWPWSSASDFLDRVGRERAAEIWKAYPLLEYGKDWDV